MSQQNQTRKKMATKRSLTMSVNPKSHPKESLSTRLTTTSWSINDKRSCCKELSGAKVETQFWVKSWLSPNRRSRLSILIRYAFMKKRLNTYISMTSKIRAQNFSLTSCGRKSWKGCLSIGSRLLRVSNLHIRSNQLPINFHLTKLIDLNASIIYSKKGAI